MRRISTALVALLLVPLMASPTRAGRILYVDADATGAGNGATWTDAYRSLQDALAAAFNGDEIRVAQGSYQPDTGGGKTLGDRTASFRLVNGVALKGGYAGFGEAKPDARDVTLYKTVLSGDLKGDDTGDVDHPSRNENTYNVVRAEGVIKTTVLDGFTITGGNVSSSDGTVGGAGMSCGNAGPTVIDCTFTKNRAVNCGGGLSSGGGTPVFTRCTFEGNWSGDRGCAAWFDHSDATLVECVFANNRGQHGGGMATSFASPTFTNCTFSGNSVKGGGGGMHNDWSAPRLTNCTFSHNSSGSTGAGMDNYESNPILATCRFDNNQAGFIGGAILNYGGGLTLTNCTFTQNSAYGGGGMCNGYGGAPTNVAATNCAFLGNLAQTSGGAIEVGSGSTVITNCTFRGNTAHSYGGAVSNGGGGLSNATVVNCILWGDTPVEIAGGTNIVRYSDVQGGAGQPWFGEGCLDTDPLFADPNGRLSSSSPCIDAGINAAVPPDVTTDLAGNRRIRCGVVDMGAYEAVASPEDLLNRAIALLQGFALASFTNPAARDGLVNQLQTVITLIRAGLYRDALDDLQDEVLPRIDGCSKTGRPDDTDWITACEAQQKVHPLVLEAIEAMEPLVKRVYTLTVSSTPGGSVATPGEGAFICNEGESVGLEAVADAEHRFTRWSGTAVDAGKVADPGSPRTSVVVDNDYTLVANFERSAPTYTVEGFESGTFAAGWSSPQYPRWYVTSEDAHSGKYSAKAGMIGDEETTTLSLQATVSEGTITFWRRVSTEEKFDVYTFSIDGKVQETVSGEHPWQEVSFPVSAGDHTFVWRYKKDESFHGGEDTVFIDDVSLPLIR